MLWRLARTSLVAAGGVNGEIHLWDVITGRDARDFKGHTLKIMALAFSPDNRLLASGSADNTVKVWDVSSGRAI